MQDSIRALSPVETVKLAENIGIHKTLKPCSSTFFSAIWAGIFISIAFLFYTTVTTGTSTVPYGFAKLVGGLCFSLGLMLVVFCGAELFTSSILTCVAKATKKITLKQLAVNWTIVYVGNLVGALILVALVWFAKMPISAQGQWGLNALQIANHKLHHTFIQALFLGILANLMVCLAVWLNYAGRTMIERMFIMMLPVAMFVACGFEHSIANMFMVPLGIAINYFSNDAAWLLMNTNAGQFTDLTITHFILNNLIPVTIGNIIGGLMVGLSYWAMYLRNESN